MQHDEEEYQKRKAAFMEASLATISAAYDRGHYEGYGKGMNDGKAVGFVAGVQSTQAALSEGLRLGSSECGKALNGIKKLGIDRDFSE
ncbi:hypothetical protein ACT3UJ_06440 [Halomonas sp. 86]|uniref:hypothetical protein n=1 Tax=unclassified Halomonas TaxID=2609666 RepID=UPI0040341B10